MIMDVSPEQLEKHLSPKEVTDDGIVNEVSPEQ
jgi:hypothetical protein